LTNIVAQVPPGRVQFFDSNGNPLVGGTVAFYIPTTLTPKTTWQDSGGVTSNANPLTLDALGSAVIWGDGSYRQIVKDASGNVVWDAVTSSVNTTVGNVYNTVAAFEAALIPSSLTAVQVLGYFNANDGGGATYVHSGVSGPGPGLVQNSNDAIWWVLANSPLNVLQFGADPTGTASSVAAFNNAIAWANAKSTTDSGVNIGIPPGQYKIDSSLTAITSNNVWFTGSRASVLMLSASGSTFTYSGGATYCGIRGASLIYPATPASTAIVITVSNAGNLTFEGFQVQNVNTLAVLGTDVSHTAHSVEFRNIQGGFYNSGKPSFDFRWGADAVLDNVNIFVDGIAVPTFNRTSTMTTVANTNCLNFTNGGWDDLHCTNVQTNRYWHAVCVKMTAAGSVTNLWLSECVWDFNSDDAISFDTTTSTNTIANIFINNSYIASWSGNGIAVYGDNLGVSEFLDFSGTHVYIAGKDGVFLQGVNTNNVRLDGMRFNAVNRLNGGTNSGINISNVLGGYWTVIGAQCHQDATLIASLGPGAYNGISVAASNFNWTVTNCGMVGSNKNYNVTLDSSFTSFITKRIMTNNMNSDYQGLQTSAPFVIPATTVAWQNNTPWVVMVSFSGMTDMGMDTTGQMFTTSGQVLVQPGHTLEPIYSGTPHAVFLVMA
jgi:hypothetical protein